MELLEPLAAVRRQIGGALRDRVAGDDAALRAAQIWGAPGERWFSQGDPIWRVHSDASMFPGGIASLLLQSLHPLAMAGVAGHSGYKGDPWGRLQRTSSYLAVTTFGTIADAEAIILRVRAIHERVRGVDPRGRPYAARDPRLLLWVHVAEVYSFLAGYQAYARTRLTPAEADTYVAQTGVAASRLGVTDLPQDVAALKSMLSSYRPELESTRAAREATRFLLLNPPLPLLLRPGYGLLASGGVALLPGWARRELRVPVFGLGTVAAGKAGAAGTATVRWAMAGLEGRRARADPS
ncbi:MAG: DUF2236 domain-containing protein [Actinomycetota bacterium]|nr:DUF2236 domain-containing protein [Actinomycetota bacterium]